MSLGRPTCIDRGAPIGHPPRAHLAKVLLGTTNRTYRSWCRAAGFDTLAIVRREEIEYFEPLLREHLEAVVRVLEERAHPYRAAVKASRREAILTYLETRSISATARQCGVSQTAIQHILAAALRHLRRLAGIRPGGLPSDWIDWPTLEPPSDSNDASNDEPDDD